MSRVASEWRQAFDDCRGFVDYRIRVERLSSISDDDAVRIFEVTFNARTQNVGYECISDSQTAAAGLVFISRANAPQSGADAFVAETFFTGVIERTRSEERRVGKESI